MTSALPRAGVIDVCWLHRRAEDGRRPLLRLLGHYLGIPAEQVVLVDDAHGKPRLADAAGALSFNWSHCQDAAVVALAHGNIELGVDVERSDRRVNVQALAERYFDASEVALLDDYDPALCRSRFLSMWTAKEAVLKALGRGLAFGLDRVVIGFDDALPVLRSVDGQHARDQDWHLVSLTSPQPAWIAALAWQGAAHTVSQSDPCIL